MHVLSEVDPEHGRVLRSGEDETEIKGGEEDEDVQATRKRIEFRFAEVVQDPLNRTLRASGIHPDAVFEPGAVARRSTTTRRCTSPLKKASRKAG
jgi:hypothetical protein